MPHGHVHEQGRRPARGRLAEHRLLRDERQAADLRGAPAAGAGRDRRTHLRARTPGPGPWPASAPRSSASSCRSRPGADTAACCRSSRRSRARRGRDDHEVLLVTADEGSAGLRRLAGRSLCDAIVMMDIEADDERIPVAASLRVPVVLVGVPSDPAGLHCVDLDFARGRPAGGRRAGGHAGTTGSSVVGHPAEVDGPRPQLRRPIPAIGARAADERAVCRSRSSRRSSRAAPARWPPWTGRALARRGGDGRPDLAGAAHLQPVLHALGARGVVPGPRHVADRRVHRRRGRRRPSRRSPTSRSSRATCRGGRCRPCSGCSTAPGAALRPVDLVSAATDPARHRDAPDRIPRTLNRAPQTALAPSRIRSIRIDDDRRRSRPITATACTYRALDQEEPTWSDVR